MHVPAAACVEACNGFEWLYFSPLLTLSLRGHRNIWLQTIIFPSEWDSSWDLRKLSLRLSVYLLCCFVLFSSTILLTSPFNFQPKKNPARVDYNLYQDMGLRYKKKLQGKVVPFANSQPTNSLMYVCQKFKSTPCTAMDRAEEIKKWSDGENKTNACTCIINLLLCMCILLHSSFVCMSAYAVRNINW